ncbi:MAG: hypothetical protein COV74_08190 [Candidatus Omnitrophica bacterium CG11_big_fil_rev_8_21_14_0_20_45_26]|uniref:Bacterial surface antigen (D15) domain-containing protein n=1 Tax=Candidatus Abzuiibacterium crystallinum TaxID=1974748 RepID=A0A2H0LM28_9BACT|nr:MAG: hypothetical protein COV74_08190 [Candidatus Omnitrophica bacterium CG11_big_fil_rev_8_21_14_0_20_45_26]
MHDYGIMLFNQAAKKTGDRAFFMLIKRLGMKQIVLLLVCTTFLFSIPASADPNDDLYTQKLRHPEETSANAIRSRALTRWIFGLPGLPIDLLKAGADPTMSYLENKRIVKKIDWAWTEIKKYGFKPETRFAPGGFRSGLGLKIEGHRLFKTDLSLPHLQYNVFGGFVNKGKNAHYYDVGADYKISFANNPSLYHASTAAFEHRPREDFFGIGPDTSLGDESDYNKDMLRLDTRLGYQWTFSLKTEGFFRYRHIQIGNGHEEDSFRIKEHFTEDQVPGIHGSNVIDLGFLFEHDTRDMIEDPMQGGYEKFEISFSDDASGDNFHYMNIEFRAARYFQLLSDRRILALRFYAGRSQPLGGGQVPFFDLQRLGGYGNQTSESDMLRGYEYNRFFDQTAIAFTPEYRYKIWNYNNFDADSVIFADIGGVSKEIHSMGFDKLRVDYGVGLRVKHLRDTFLSIEAAHGNEGIQFYIRSKAPF